MAKYRNLSLRERFDIQHEPIPESGCWIWTGHVSKSGYGNIKDNYQTKRAHRVAYELFKGRIPDDLVVCHKCDVPSCVNPDHLFLGTPKENTRDMIDKGRQVKSVGTQHWNSRLSPDDIIAIRSSKESDTELSRKYGISRGSIWQIRAGKKWASVPWPSEESDERKAG